MRLEWALLAAGVAGCYQPAGRECAIRCGAEGRCPSGFECAADGYCHGEGDSASCGLSPDAPAPDAGPPPSCGTAASFADDFTGQRAGFWFDYWGPNPETAGDFEVSSDQGSFRVDAGTGSRYVTICGRSAYDLRGSAFTIEVPEVPSAAEARAFLRVRTGWGGGAMSPREKIEIAAEAGTLAISVATLAGTGGDSLAHDPVAHRFWRIAEEAGQVRVETSPDGADYVLRYAEPTPPFVELAFLQVGVSTTGTGSVTSIFDGLNRGGTPLPWCQAETLVDDFSGAEVMRGWAASDFGDGSLEQTGGQVLFHSGVAASSGAYYYTHTAYRLTGSSLTIQLVDPPPSLPPGIDVFLDATADGVGRALIAAREAMLHMEAKVDGIGPPALDVPYPAGHRFWRLREDGGRLHFETSADGASFTDHGDVEPPFPLERLILAFGIEHDAALAAPITVAVDSVNLR